MHNIDSMIETISNSAFGLYIVIAAFVLWICNIITQTMWKYIALLLCMICLSIPIIDGFNAIELVYSFFDSPSIFCVLIAIVFIIKNLLRDSHILCDYSYKLSVIALHGALSSALYLGSLNIFPYIDFYHYDPIWQGIIIGIIVIIALYLDIVFAILLILALCIGYVSRTEMLDSIICVYLWLYCIYYVLYSLIRYCKQWIMTR